MTTRPQKTPSRASTGNTPKISDAEWEVMEAVWEGSPVPALEVVERLASSRPWRDQTIRTMLGRLVRKGALTTEQDGKRFLYRPTFRREQFVRDKSRGFLTKIMRGLAAPVLVQLVQETNLSSDEIKQLKAILDKKDPFQP